MKKAIKALLMCVALVMATSSLAQLRAVLSQSTVAQGQSVVLTLESDEAVSAPPDLSALEQDFHVVNRSTSRSSRSFNGRRSQSTTINLTLVPKRSGSLTIPAIDFGQARSQPLQLSVTPAADGSTDLGLSDTQDTAPMQPAPFPFPLPGQGFTPPSGFPWNQGPGGMQGWNNQGLGVPDQTAPQQSGGWQAQPEETTAAAPAEGTDGYWPWITGLLLGGWILTTLVLTWRINRSPQRSAAPDAPEARPHQQAAAALVEVEHAYRRNDAFAAKTALLRWAAIHWPADPPRNLGRLAAHCPAAVQRHIIKLDQSFHSPKPIAWNEAAVWETLRDLPPSAAQGAAPPTASTSH